MKKNNTLDFIRTIACVLVVFIHISFPGDFGYYVSAIARFAVPFFFMVSGYFAYKENGNGLHIFKQLKKIILLALLSVSLYFIFSYIISIYTRNLNFIQDTFNFQNLKYFVLFNSLPVGSHLWYLFSLIYVYIIYYLSKYVFKIDKILYIFIPILLLSCILIEYFVVFDFIFYKNIVFRNFLFIGLPFFMLGNLINKYKDSYFIKLLENKILLFFSLFGLLIVLFEAYCSDYMDLYFGSILLSSSIFLYGIKNGSAINAENMVCKFGKNYSLGIYIVHCVFISLYSIFIVDYDNILVQWCAPFIILILSFVVVYIYYEIKNKLIKN